MTITMYGADWCGDCIRAKAYFNDNGVDYSYVDLEETPEATETVLERNNGVKRIPVIVFSDDSHLTEPSNEALANKLAELVSDSSSAPNTAQEFEVIENAEDEQFQLVRDGEIISVANFSERGGSVVLPHVATEPEHRGQGYATQLMDGVVEILRDTNRKATPICPFASGYFRSHPEHSDLLA